MRAMLDPAFSQFLLRIGEGKELVDANGEITLPPDIVIPYYDKEQSLNRLTACIRLYFIYLILLFISAFH